MKRMIVLMMLVCSCAWADLYVTIDKETGKCLGTAEVNANDIGDWASKYTMKKAGEEYRGKQGYELKFKSGKISPATDKEISDYLKEENNKLKAKKRQDALDTLEITEEDLKKLE